MDTDPEASIAIDEMEPEFETPEEEVEEERPPRNPMAWVVTFVLVVVILGAAAYFGLPYLSQFSNQSYYTQAYQPVDLLEAELAPSPDTYENQNVPWFSSSEWLSQSTSLQMIAAYYGIDQPRRFSDFLMGYTYGASNNPAQSDFFPGGTDPQVGFVAAAPFFNRSVIYYTTDDPILYQQALRAFLAQGYPIQVALDYTVLYELEGPPITHSEVLIGYDGENFSYYEPVCGAESPCEPGEKRPGGKGLLVPRQKLLDAVLSQSKLMGYPWKYSFTLFEAGLSAADLRPIWRRNGQTTIGETRFGPQQGAVVIEELADRIEKNGVGMDLTTVRQNLEITASVREENARFLRDVFQGDEKIQLAASLYDQVIEKYRKVLAKTTEPIPDELTAIDIAAVLREAAAAERQIGTLFLEVGY